MTEQHQSRILFVCMGNICRSPTAHGVFRARVREAGLEEVLAIESAGTHDYHIGKSPDPRSVEAALERGYDIRDLRARQVMATDFATFDYILAMDRVNLDILAQVGGRGDASAELALFLDYHPELRGREVPDPYYGAINGFEEVLDLVEAGADALLTHVRKRHAV